MRGYVVALSAAGLILGQAVVAGTAQATPTAGHHTNGVTSNSLNVSISGVPKARVKVKGNGFKHVVRSSTVLRLSAGTYRVRAFNVNRAGTSYRPNHRSYTLRAKGGQSFIVAVEYAPVAQAAAGNGSPKGIPASPVPDGPIATMFALVNEARSQRQQCGAKSMPPVPPVAYNADIAEAAQAHAEDMAAKNYFEHTSLDGRSFVDRIEATAYAGDPAGENIASGFPTPEDTMRGWLKSPGHCTNLMDPDFDDMGLGVADRTDARYSTPISYWVQDFGYDPAAG